MFYVGGHFYNKAHRNWLLDQPKKYCYGTYYGPANSAFIMEDDIYKHEFIDYYIRVEKSRKPEIFNFPLKTLPFNDYIVGYDEDSVLVKVVSLYNRGPYRGGSYLKGWVYHNLLYDISGKEFNKLRNDTLNNRVLPSQPTQSKK